jgi:hypothetical protein
MFDRFRTQGKPDHSRSSAHDEYSRTRRRLLEPLNKDHIPAYITPKIYSYRMTEAVLVTTGLQVREQDRNSPCVSVLYINCPS